MKIVTFNLQNDLIKETIDKKELLINFIKMENPDIICFQELNFKLKKYIEENIQNYIIVGTSRYQTNSFIDEYNSILIKKDIDLLETKTFPLYKRFKHDFFSIFPRICTYVKLKKANQTFQIYNTHLDHLFNYTRKHQLQILKKHLHTFFYREPLFFHKSTKYLLLHKENQPHSRHIYRDIRNHIISVR